MSIKKNLMDTICRDCVFAIRDGTKKNKQVVDGCEFDRIKKFKKNGIGVKYNKKLGYHELKVFCNYCRNKDWAKTKDGDLKEYVRDFNKFVYTVIVNVTDWYSDRLLKTILGSLRLQDIAPNEIIFNIYDKSSVQQEGVVEDILKNSDLGIKWRVEKLNIRQLVDTLHARHYVLFDDRVGGLPEDFSKNVEKAINHDLKRFVAIRPTETHPYTLCISPLVLPVIEERAKEQKLTKLIIEYEEIA